MFLEDYLSVQSLVVSQIGDAICPVTKAALNGVRADIFTGRKKEGFLTYDGE